MVSLVLFFKDKFGKDPRLTNQPPMFPDDDVKKLKKKLMDGSRRMLMVGEKESELNKELFPLPRLASKRTEIPAWQYPEGAAASVKQMDLFKISKGLFSRGQFSDNAKIIMTHNGVG